MKTYEMRDHAVVKMGARAFLQAADKGNVIDARFVPPRLSDTSHPFGLFTVKVRTADGLHPFAPDEGEMDNTFF
jgi:hypothetical protein